jgi:hypothetical protein
MLCAAVRGAAAARIQESLRLVLNMRITRGPLAEREYAAILTEYNRLTLAEIPMAEFLRWVQDSPEGPAWHALLETDEARIVGHTSVLPVRAGFQEKQLMSGMSEYSFVHEDFRKMKIRGMESVGRPAFIILLDTLFQHCIKQGCEPVFASTNEKNQVFTRKVGLRPAEFPLKECLLALRPAAAAKHTPNLSSKQRAALLAIGTLQKALWTVIEPFSRRTNGVQAVPIGSEKLCTDMARLSFYEERESLKWRFIPEQYILFMLDRGQPDYVIAKRGREDRYLRVCQYRLSSPESVVSVVHRLIKQVNMDDAMGIRWAVYDDGELTEGIVAKLRKLGFLCANRTRIVMVHKDFPAYLQPSAWRMSDTHFCFDP